MSDKQFGWSLTYNRFESPTHFVQTRARCLILLSLAGNGAERRTEILTNIPTLVFAVRTVISNRKKRLFWSGLRGFAAN